MSDTTQTVQLDDLLGEHVLTGVDYGETRQVKVYEWRDETESVNVMRFVLDGVTYIAVENPDDGYRSTCRDLEVTQGPVSNTFPGIRVVGKKMDNGTYHANDVLQLIDAANGNVVLEVGTADADDYYPCCVMSWHPDRLAVNGAKAVA
jgi:hypothetical protein